MIDMILDADGITVEMREAQREKMRVMEMFLQVGPDQWPAVVEEQQAVLDHEFFQMILATAENAAETGKGDMADALMQLYSYLVQNTAVGQDIVQMAETQEETVRAVAEEIQAMGDDMTREDFLNLVLSYADDDERLQALVGLMRPALDYTFFQELTRRLDAAQGDERERLSRLRQTLLDLSSVIDQQTQLVLQRAADTLRVIANSQDLDAAIRPRLDQIDDTFLAVLQANIRAAEQNKDQRSAERLAQILQKVLEILRESAPPQIRLINDLMSTTSDDEAREIIDEHAPSFGAELPELMDVIADDLEANNQARSAQRLRSLRDYAATHITPQA
jgi:hypothetical protein